MKTPATDPQRRMLRAIAQQRSLTMPSSAQLSNLGIGEVSDVKRKLENDIDVFGSGHRAFEPIEVATEKPVKVDVQLIELQEFVHDLLSAHRVQADIIDSLTEIRQAADVDRAELHQLLQALQANDAEALTTIHSLAVAVGVPYPDGEPAPGLD